MDSSKLFKKILLHPGEFIIPRRVYRDCKGLDSKTMMIRLNELVDEGLGCVIERTQQQTIFYKEIPSSSIEDSLRNHGVELEEYRAKFFEEDYKCGERQRKAIKTANPDRRLIDALYNELIEDPAGENEGEMHLGRSEDGSEREILPEVHESEEEEREDRTPGGEHNGQEDGSESESGSEKEVESVGENGNKTESEEDSERDDENESEEEVGERESRDEREEWEESEREE